MALVNPRVPSAVELIRKIKSKTAVYTLEVPAVGARGVMKRLSGDEPAGDKWVNSVKRAIAGA